ncbi:NADH-ubiquinone oxidoreductase 19. subunit, mitochondrial [Colletotrichum spaethianum]|uniref:NADH-ubiquinone oxidoreductase 19. subunit, mitochondrial n=1 Tax=Colletotrichum spaethianum TaxID=700344 RepID=A0AA37PHY0_9PEZI|nr:NADH-ubiquinone oxidoreductase 19. subunit, mitochondrial [Colletotrichum spaethianum]GKT52537.1 NADH-ubiquinone oxidoreductase 19. subunit, mitochondrial [Colletotrichum spaethianum]
MPFRIAAASISSSSRKDASPAAAHSTGLIKKERKEVPLPSQEGTKGVMQYALYDSRSHTHIPNRLNVPDPYPHRSHLSND